MKTVELVILAFAVWRLASLFANEAGTVPCIQKDQGICDQEIAGCW
jgi:hypothetical protein